MKKFKNSRLSTDSRKLQTLALKSLRNYVITAVNATKFSALDPLLKRLEMSSMAG